MDSWFDLLSNKIQCKIYYSFPFYHVICLFTLCKYVCFYWHGQWMDSLQCCFSVVFAWRWDEDNHAWFHVCMERRKYNIAFLSCRIPQTRIPKMLPMKVKNVGSKREKSAWTLFHVSIFHEKQTCIASILVLNLHIIYVYYRSCCCYFFEEERERFESDSRKVNFFSENRFPIPNNIHIFFSIFLLPLVYCHTTPLPLPFRS